MNKKEEIIGYYCLEDCTLESHIYEYGEELVFLRRILLRDVKVIDDFLD